MIENLPIWNCPNLKPAFNDLESATAVEMVYKLYGKNRELIDDYNKFLNDIQNEVETFKTSTNQDYECFRNAITKICNDYIKTMDMKIDCQDRKVADAIQYMKDNLVTTILNLNEDNELDNMIMEAVSNTEKKLETKQKNYEANINAKISSISNGSPLIASSIEEMTDTSKVYVNTTDGKWYYFNGTNWAVGGVYQATELADGSVTKNKIGNDFLKELLGMYVERHNLYNKAENTLNKALSQYGTLYDTTTYFVSGKINVRNLIGKTLYFSKNGVETAFYNVCSYDKNDILIEHKESWIKNYVIPANTEYIRFTAGIDNSNANIQVEIDVITPYQEYYDAYYTPYNEEVKRGINNQSLEESYIIGFGWAQNYKYPIIKNIDSKCYIGLGNPMYLMNRKGRIIKEILTYKDNFTQFILESNQALIWDTENNKLITKTIGTAQEDYITNVNDVVLLRNYQGQPQSGLILPFYAINKVEKLNKNINNSCKFIAHQGISNTSETVGNSRLSSIKNAKESGYSIVEVDIIYSSDNIPMCCHDESFIDKSTNETIVIGEHTEQELKNYNYYGETIASFEEIVYYCKMNGLKINIDHLYYPTVNETRKNNLINIIKKYKMEKEIIWSINALQNQADLVLNFDNKSTIAVYITKQNYENDIAFANLIKTNDNTIILSLNYTEFTKEEIANINLQYGNKFKILVWVIDEINMANDYVQYSDFICSNCVLFNHKTK